MNKVILMGRLTRDPEMRTTQSGKSVVRFTLAVNRRFKDSSGNYPTDFINCRAWDKTAEFVARYFRKGDMMALVGSIQTSKYEHEGKTVYTTDINADEVYFCGSKNQNADNYADMGEFADIPYDDNPPF